MLFWFFCQKKGSGCIIFQNRQKWPWKKWNKIESGWFWRHLIGDVTHLPLRHLVRGVMRIRCLSVSGSDVTVSDVRYLCQLCETWVSDLPHVWYRFDAWLGDMTSQLRDACVTSVYICSVLMYRYFPIIFFREWFDVFVTSEMRVLNT